MAEYQVIVVGGGLAGSAAAYTLARAGHSVLVVERGEKAGSKNMTGGRIYTHALETLIPEFRDEAPLERRIAVEKISLCAPGSATTVSHRGEQMGESYSVLRAKFDPWLAAKAQEAGAEYVCGIRVDDLLIRNGKVCGIRATGETVTADAVILADGVNSFLAQKAGLRGPADPDATAVGVKEVIELGAAEVEKRFGLGKDEGAAWLSAGDPTGGILGGGFLYTNKTSVSLGVVATLSRVKDSPYSVPEMLEHFKHMPEIEPLVAGGKLVEYSAHLVPEGGYNALPRLYGDGVLVCGDAAGMVINLGILIRGMDLAIESGRLAAEALMDAGGDFTRPGLARYESLLRGSFVLQDMKQYRRMPGFLESPRIFTAYPRMAAEILDSVFRVDGTPQKPIVLKAIPPVWKAGIPGLIADAVKGVTSL